MIRMESVSKHEVHRRTNWVVLTIGADRYLLTPTEAVAVANQLVDATEQEVTA